MLLTLGLGFVAEVDHVTGYPGGFELAGYGTGSRQQARHVTVRSPFHDQPARLGPLGIAGEFIRVLFNLGEAGGSSHAPTAKPCGIA